MTKTKILIAGIGGVGGYFGGLLAYHYFGSKNMEISFLSRGEHLKQIQNNGLKVIKGNVELIAKPKLATNNASEIGIADYIIVATKSYDLELVMHQLQPCINQDTIILPLLNGINNRERLLQIYPKNLVLDGCAFIVSRLKQFGVIENSGHIQTLYFGLDNFESDRLSLLEKICKEANIETVLSKNISTIIWEKFIFISPTATATCYFDTCIGEIVSDKDKLATTTLLIEEIKQIAKAKNIYISEDITEKTLLKLKALSYETTTSMHVDFQNRKHTTELESLTGYVVIEGRKYNLKTPMYLKIYKELQTKVMR